MQAAIPVSLLLFFVLSNGAGAKALANQSLEKRVNTPMRVVDEQQKPIRSLERQVAKLMRAAAAAGDASAQPDTPQRVAHATPRVNVPGAQTGTATGVPLNPPPPGSAAAGDAPDFVVGMRFPYTF